MTKPPVYSGELQKIDGHPCNLIGETKIHYMVMENYQNFFSKKVRSVWTKFFSKSQLDVGT